MADCILRTGISPAKDALDHWRGLNAHDVAKRGQSELDQLVVWKVDVVFSAEATHENPQQGKSIRGAPGKFYAAPGTGPNARAFAAWNNKTGAIQRTGYVFKAEAKRYVAGADAGKSRK